MPGSWTSPRTWVDGETETASIFNTHVRDNLLYLGGLTGAITQSGRAVATTSGPTTTSSTPVDMPEMTVTLTTTGGDLLWWFNGTFTNTVANATLQLTPVSSAGTVSGGGDIYAQVAGNLCSGVGIGMVTSLAAGSVTFKIQWSTNTGTLTSNGVRRWLTVLEVKR
jgi:hypothetical protein